METPSRAPEMQPRELKNHCGWYVLVDWGHRPSEQIGGFASEIEAQAWIDENAFGWLKKRFYAPNLTIRGNPLGSDRL